jgi:hypothetical protein
VVPAEFVICIVKTADLGRIAGNWKFRQQRKHPADPRTREVLLEDRSHVHRHRPRLNRLPLNS